MVSKNNRAKQMENVAERQPHFSIRKLTIGAASVLLFECNTLDECKYK